MADTTTQTVLLVKKSIIRKMKYKTNSNLQKKWCDKTAKEALKIDLINEHDK